MHAVKMGSSSSALAPITSNSRYITKVLLQCEEWGLGQKRFYFSISDLTLHYNQEEEAETSIEELSLHSSGQPQSCIP
jgi:hypothetical protein